MNQALFTPVNLGKIALQNRIVMAPMTRNRAAEDGVPTAIMAEHYSQRASGGLLIAEATMAMEGNSSFWMEPGIYSDAQVQGWKAVTDAVVDGDASAVGSWSAKFAGIMLPGETLRFRRA